MIPMAVVVGSPSRLPGIREKEEEERAENKDDCFGYSFNSLSLSPPPPYWPVERDFVPRREATRGNFMVARGFRVSLPPVFHWNSIPPVSMVIPGYEAARKINGTKSSQPVIGRKWLRYRDGVQRNLLEFLFLSLSFLLFLSWKNRETMCDSKKFLSREGEETGSLFLYQRFFLFFLSFIDFTPSKRQEQKRLVLISAIVGQGGRGNGLKVNWLSCWSLHSLVIGTRTRIMTRVGVDNPDPG